MLQELFDKLNGSFDAFFFFLVKTRHQRKTLGPTVLDLTSANVFCKRKKEARQEKKTVLHLPIKSSSRVLDHV